MDNQNQNDNKKKVLSFQEFVRDCINRILLGGAALIILYFLCRSVYDGIYLSRVADLFGEAFRH